MKNTKKTLKTIAFSLVLAAMTLTVTDLNAQNKGLFGKGGSAADKEPMGGGMMRGDYGINSNDKDGITNYNIGDPQGTPAPLGSGIAIMLAAGLGYVALKKKED